VNACAFFFVWLAVLAGNLAGTAPVGASPSAPDLVVTPKLKVRSKHPVGGAQVRVTPWPVAGSADDMNERARAVAIVIGSDSLGRRLSNWIQSHSGRIEEFHGNSYGIVPTEYWVLRHTSTLQG
jgi:hypothetical protein